MGGAIWIRLPVIAIWLYGCSPVERVADHRGSPPVKLGQDVARSQPASPAGDEWTNSIGMRFRVVPPGDLVLVAPRKVSLNQMSVRGASRRRSRGEPPLPPPVRRPARVTRAFSIGVCEVTHAEFERVMGGDRAEDADRPVGVSWKEAVEFCRSLSQLPGEQATGTTYRLPTQAEWQLAGVEECFPFRLMPEHVSVWNWCLDLYDVEYYRALPEDMPTRDPRGAASGTSHVVMHVYSHPDPFRRLLAFRVVTEQPP